MALVSLDRTICTMSRSKKKPIVLVLESPDPAQNIILALDDLEKNNSSLKRALSATDKLLLKTKDLLRKL